MGFALLTAAVTWVLQLYPALARRRALAVRLRLLRQAQDAQPLEYVAERLTASALHGLAAEIAAIRVDFAQNTEMYYFHDGHGTSLAEAVPYLMSLSDAGSRSERPEVRLAWSVLDRSLDDLASVIDAQYLRTGQDTAAVFAAYGRDHWQTDRIR